MAARRPLVVVAGEVKEITAGDTIPPEALGTGTPDGTKYLRDDGQFVTPPDGGTSTFNYGLSQAVRWGWSML